MCVFWYLNLFLSRFFSDGVDGEGGRGREKEVEEEIVVEEEVGETEKEMMKEEEVNEKGEEDENDEGGRGNRRQERREGEGKEKNLEKKKRM